MCTLGTAADGRTMAVKEVELGGGADASGSLSALEREVGVMAQLRQMLEQMQQLQQPLPLREPGHRRVRQF